MKNEFLFTKSVNNCSLIWRRYKTTSASSSKCEHHEQMNSQNVSKFSFACHGSFVQAEPKHQNAWRSDSFLQSYLKLNIPENVFNEIVPDLDRFGHRAATDIWKLGRECEENPPMLKSTNAWGQRIDEIVTCPAWKKQKAISAEEGLIAIPYENKQVEYSRLYQCAKLFMYSPSSGLYSCPLAMTDGAAKTIQSLNLSLPEAWNNLTTRNPDKFWTSGQWMTEQRGGSDVGGGAETEAVQQPNGTYNLYGYKWFSSATDSDMALTLARIKDFQGNTKPGSKGLSMFYLKTRDANGTLNNIQVVKLKNKLGTRQLPTAELLLDGTIAELVGDEGRGIPNISNMLTITRIHNAISSVALMRKITSLSRDYARHRRAFQTTIDRHPLHIQTMARMEVDTRGCSVLMLDLARQLGLHDNKCISDQDLLLLRLMTPVAKLFTAKMAVATVSEGLECFGGQGYIEDTGLPGMLRDAQVLPIWEGTSNVMSLDVLRSISKSRGEALLAYQRRIDAITSLAIGSALLGKTGVEICSAARQVLDVVSQKPEILELCARDLAISLANIYIGALLLEHAMKSGDKFDAQVAEAWGHRTLAPILSNTSIYTKEYIENQRELVYLNYNEA